MHARESDHPLDRRAALGAIAGIATAGLAGSAAGQPEAAPVPAPFAGILSAEELGWDARRREFRLPPLPYAVDALGPHVEAETLELHHLRQHAGHVTRLNDVLRRLALLHIGQLDGDRTRDLLRELAVHGAGHVAHCLLWRTLAPPADGGGVPPEGSAFARQLLIDFRGFEKMWAHLSTAARTLLEPGWAWLVWEPGIRRLLVLQVEGSARGMLPGVIPLVGIDMWEHAYYLQHRGRVSDYLLATFRVVDWAAVERRFELVSG